MFPQPVIKPIRYEYRATIYTTIEIQLSIEWVENKYHESSDFPNNCATDQQNTSYTREDLIKGIENCLRPRIHENHNVNGIKDSEIEALVDYFMEEIGENPFISSGVSTILISIMYEDIND